MRTRGFTSLLLIFSLGLVLIGRTPVHAAAADRYTLSLEQANFPAGEVIPALNYDFDGDGIRDTVATWNFYFYGITVVMSKTGQAVSFGPGNAGFGDLSVVSFNADGSYPSIVFSLYTYDPSTPSGFGSAQQKVAFNNQGTFSYQTIPLSVAGRGVACTRNFPGRSNPVCFFADYSYGYDPSNPGSRLVELGANGSVADITGAVGLPYLFGFRGVALFDFSGDGLPDLVTAGNKIMVAFSQSNGTVTHSLVDTVAGSPDARNMDIAVPLASDMPAGNMPPCAYFSMQTDYGYSDFVRCYDRVDQVWYDLSLPVTSWSYNRPVRFWERNGNVVFAAENGSGTLNLFRLNAPISATPALKLGDIDGNDTVDIFDYNALVAKFGQNLSTAEDIDRNGRVDIFDYNLLVTNFGQ